MSHQEQLIQHLGALTAALESQQQNVPSVVPAAPVAPQMTVPPEMLQQWMQQKMGVPAQETQAPAQNMPEATQDFSDFAQRLEATEQTLQKMHTAFEAMLKHLSQEMETRFKHLVMRMDLEQKQNADRMQKMELELALLKRDAANDATQSALVVEEKPQMRDIISDISAVEIDKAPEGERIKENSESSLQENEDAFQPQDAQTKAANDEVNLSNCSQKETPEEAGESPRIASRPHPKNRPRKLAHRKKQRHAKGSSASSRDEAQNTGG